MTAYFIDLDGVVVKQGTQTLLPGAKEKLDSIAANGGEIYFFSCWAFNAHDVIFLTQNFPYAKGFIRKPLADVYAYVDDRLDLSQCGVSLNG